MVRKLFAKESPERVAGSTPAVSACPCGDCGQHEPLKPARSPFESDRGHHFNTLKRSTQLIPS